MVTDAQKRATAKYNKDHYLTFTIRLPKNLAEEFQKYMQQKEFSSMNQAAISLLSTVLFRRNLGIFERAKFILKK